MKKYMNCVVSFHLNKFFEYEFSWDITEKKTLEKKKQDIEGAVWGAIRAALERYSLPKKGIARGIIVKDKDTEAVLAQYDQMNVMSDE